MRLHLTLILTLLGLTTQVSAEVLTLKKGDHICLVGNALGERMQHQNYFETMLHQRFSKHELVVRNLCFPGDEPLFRLRSLNFGSPDDHLKHSKASVILFFFGYNESFKGHHGLKSFTDDLTKLIKETKTKNYSGKGAPRMVLISPSAFENTGDPNLPDGTEHNKRLSMYAKAMQKVAKETGIGFVDLFTPMKARLQKKDRLTYDGADLNQAGYQALAPILFQGLFGESVRLQLNEKLRAEIADKNFHWWHRYRAVNGYSIYGTRGKAGFDGRYRNRDVMERERAILDQMCANRDRRIWKVARGEKVPAKVDDSNTLPFFDVKTNVGGPNDPNRKRGKLGSLKYISAKEQKKYFKLAPGYEINLVASEEQFPDLANPVSMNFDNKGRLWVSTMPSYPQWKPKTKLNDKLLILTDTDGDGKADQCKVFANGLHQPTGFEIGHGGAYVAQQPDILFLRDTDGDDKADVRIRRLIGFDTADSHHGLAAFEWGPGGGLYFQEGTFKQSQVESIYGPLRLSDAGVWRFDARTARMDVHVSLAFANPWGHVFDRWGQNFIADASPGQNFWATPISGDIIYPDKHPGGCRDGHLDWGGSRSKKHFPTFLKKRIRPSSGCEIVSSRHFPPEAQGNFLVNNVIGDLAVLQHTVKEEGSGFVAKEITPLVQCTHGNFRPVDLQFGPDGALYIVDWHNALIGHLQHNLRDPSRDHSHGRIWRVTYKKRPLIQAPKIAGEEISKLLDLLKLPEDRARYCARREIAQRKTEVVIPAVKGWVAKLDPKSKDHEHHLLEALWVHQTHNRVNRELLDRVLRSSDHRARAAATRVVSFWRHQIDDTLAILKKCVNDKHPRVRLEAVRACSFIHSPKSLELVLDALNHEVDYYLEYTLDETIRVIEGALGVGSSGHAHHGHGTKGKSTLVFLDKSPKVVQFQLARFSPSQLLNIERNAKDAKFKPVHEAILTRKGISRKDREKAVEALVSLNRSNQVEVLLSAIAKADSSAVQPLARMMLSQSPEMLAEQIKAFEQAVSSTKPTLRAMGFAGLITMGKKDYAWKLARTKKVDYLASIALLPSRALTSKTFAKESIRSHVISCLNPSEPLTVRREAIKAMRYLPTKREETFRLVARSIRNGKLRSAAVQTLLSVPKKNRPADASQMVVDALVKLAEKTPARRRTTPPFLTAMSLADELLSRIPAEKARAYRKRLRAVVVRVIRINTVHEEMRYDKPYFVVEAGKAAQVVLFNDDLMPHNLVITNPGKLKDVAMLAADMSPTPDRQGKAYVPKSKDVLFSTKLVESHQQGILTFTAPSKPGAYNYVCTVPNHWMRMYGVMLVVKDLEAWNASPVIPKDPLGVTRPLVKNWKVDDFEANLDALLAKRQPSQGLQIFKEATCVMCHRAEKVGGAVGPDLTDAFKRWKHDPRVVLREILDPSHTIEDKHALYKIELANGKTVSGVITKQDRETVTIITNPEKPKPLTIKRDDIDDMIKSAVSLMPKGLLDRYTREEIYDLLAYLKSISPQ